jgi:hypothetical protein
MWSPNASIDWLLDKKTKSDIILFSADENSMSEMIIGYLAAQRNSYYFGNLRDFYKANDRSIYGVIDLLNLLNKIS